MKWSRSEFLFQGPDDFVRLDSLCARFLGDYFRWLQGPEGGALAPQDASDLAHCADRYLRDFVVDILETGPADPDPSPPRLYLSNWYIVNTLTPSHEEVDRILLALRKLYELLALHGIVSDSTAARVARDLGDPAGFHRRLDDFWDLTPEGIGPWRKTDDYRTFRERPS